MADLTFKIDADTGGFLGAIKKAGTTIKDFGIIGGPPILAVKAAMAGVATAAKLAETAVKGVGTAASSVAAGGKSMVGLLNQVNGAVELMHKVLPALTFPLMMAKNAEKVTGAFNELKTSWEGVAGALGEGVNDALTPILKAAGVEVAKLKVQAKGIGQSIGDTIDLTRVSYQMGQLPQLLWLNLQKVMLQWGDSIWKLIQDMGYKMGAEMEMAMSRAIIFWKENAWEWIGGDKAGAAKERETMQRTAAEYNKPRPDLLGSSQGKIDELTAQISALSDPMKARISQEKTLAEVTEATSAAFVNIKAGLANFFGTGEKSGPEGTAKPKALDDWQGPIKGYSDEETQRAAEGLGLARKSKPAPASSPAAPSPSETAEAGPSGRVNSTAENKLGRRLIRGAGFGGKMAQKLEAKNLAKNVTNKTGGASADKAKGEAAQRDGKSLAAADIIMKSMPTVTAALLSMQKSLSQAESR